MIEAIEVTPGEGFSLFWEAEEPAWKKTGQAALIGFSLLAACATLPALCRKRRTYSLVFSQGMPPAVADMPIGENPLPEPIPRCSKEDANRIQDVFRTTAAPMLSPWWLPNPAGLGNPKNVLRLLEHKRILVEHKVHPFEFLNQTPRNLLRSIFQEGNSLKINGVMDGVESGMKREQASLTKHIPALATAFGKDAQRITPLIRVRDWRGLVDYLFGLDP